MKNNEAKKTGSALRKNRFGLLIVATLTLAGCQATNQQHPGNSTDQVNSAVTTGTGTGTVAIPTIKIPKTLTSPTRHSERVRMGSASRARDFLCQFMSNYTLVLNADFDATLNVFKHRAGRMGADWIAITGHTQVMAGTEAKSNLPIHVLDDSTVLTEYDTLTKLQGAIFDCK